MANRLSQEKANAIATEYCTNGYKKVESLLRVGYSDTYAKHVGLKLFDNDTVKQAISRIEARKSAETAFTTQQAEQEYEEVRVLAMAINQPAAASTAITGKARLYGMDKDNDAGKADQPESITEEQAARWRAMADAATAELLNRPKLSKGA